MGLEAQAIGDLVQEAISCSSVLGPLAREWEEVRGTPRQWNLLRRVYSYMTPLILSGDRQGPYFLNWSPAFTPIERDVWSSIRGLGLPFFPQYPVGRYFADFADPIKRIALECDGKAWHDPIKDAARDAEFNALGWSVVRFTGRRCFMAEDNPESAHADLDQLAEIYREESRDALEAEDEF